MFLLEEDGQRTMLIVCRKCRKLMEMYEPLIFSLKNQEFVLTGLCEECGSE